MQTNFKITKATNIYYAFHPMTAYPMGEQKRNILSLHMSKKENGKFKCFYFTISIRTHFPNRN